MFASDDKKHIHNILFSVYVPFGTDTNLCNYYAGGNGMLYGNVNRNVLL